MHNFIREAKTLGPNKNKACTVTTYKSYVVNVPCMKKTFVATAKVLGTKVTLSPEEEADFSARNRSLKIVDDVTSGKVDRTTIRQSGR